MSVGVLIITHDGIGSALLEAVNHMIENKPLKARFLSASRQCDPDELLKTANEYFDAVDDGDGVLVLTDLIGSTPSNIAHRLNRHDKVNIITGINLSMLIRIFNYPQLGLNELTEKAYSGGIDGITISQGEKK
ncbi:MAG: PTS sugar transporter subunit IIA [Gammaproteobacteria bacterium]|jgi:PTS system mannose-specific IIA component